MTPLLAAVVALAALGGPVDGETIHADLLVVGGTESGCAAAGW